MEADEATRQGELSHDEEPSDLAESQQQPVSSGDSARRRSTRGKRESARAKLRRKTGELVDGAAQLISGKRRSEGRSQQAHTTEGDIPEPEANGSEEVGQEEASEQLGQQPREEQGEGQHEAPDEEENDQPEGTPAKSRRRSSRFTSQLSRSPLRALTNMLPASVTSRLSSVGENGKRTSAVREGNNHTGQQHEAETTEVEAEGDTDSQKVHSNPSSLFDWRWLLPGLLVALLTSLALVQLFQPHLLPWSSSHLHSSSAVPLQTADWERLSSSFLPIRDWQSFKQRWEKWVEDDKRRAEEIVGAVKEWVEAKFNKLDHRKSSAEAVADVSELRSEVSQRLSEARAGWLHEVGDLIEQRVTSTLGNEAKARHADVQRASAELRSEMEQRVADELQRGTDELLTTIREEVQQRVSQQADVGEERAAQWQLRLKDEVTAVERRAVDAALAVVDKRFVSGEQLQAVDDDIRRYIQATLAAQAEQYATAEELKQVESRVMTAVQRMTDQRQQQHSEENRLTADDRKQLIAAVMDAVREEWAAEKLEMKNELRAGLLKEAGEEVVSGGQSGAIEQLKRQIAELEQRLISSQSTDGALDSSTRQWVEDRVQSVLEKVQYDDSAQQADMMRKLSVMERLLDELRAGTASLAHSPSPSAPSDMAAALERFAADRTARVDYALASSGGRIVAHSPTHRAALSSSSVVSPLLALFTSRHLPEVPAEALLDADMSVGHCWPMQRQQGGVIIGLRERVRISGLSLQHASVHVLPDGGASMPRAVRVSGVEDEQLDEAVRQVTLGGVWKGAEQVGSVLGRFEYERDGSQVQQWPVGAAGAGAGGRGYQYVRLDVLSNYGNSNYTCIYRVRVHGEPVKGQ